MTRIIISIIITVFMSRSDVKHNMPVPTETDMGSGVVVIGSGAVSGAVDGLFERVAMNRINGLAEPTLPIDTDINSYDALIATESCDYVGWRGLLIVSDGDRVATRSALVVDCQDERHKLNGGSLTDLGLIADVSERSKDIWHWRGYIVLSER